MAKKKIRERVKSWGELIEVAPILLVMSLTVNVLVIAFLMYTRTDGMSRTLLNYSLERACGSDYEHLKTSTDAKNWAYLSEQVCHRNYKTGAAIKGWVTQDGSYSSATK